MAQYWEIDFPPALKSYMVAPAAVNTTPQLALI